MFVTASIDAIHAAAYSRASAPCMLDWFIKEQG